MGFTFFSVFDIGLSTVKDIHNFLDIWKKQLFLLLFLIFFSFCNHFLCIYSSS